MIIILGENIYAYIVYSVWFYIAHYFSATGGFEYHKNKRIQFVEGCCAEIEPEDFNISNSTLIFCILIISAVS